MSIVSQLRAGLLVIVLGATAAAAQAAPPATSLPRPDGFVNDFAAVLSDSTKRALRDVLIALRDATGGEIAVVTVVDLGGQTPASLARRYGNEWGIGAKSGPAQNAGAVILIAPRETSTDGSGHCRIELGDAATRFISDSSAAAICEAAVPAFRRRDYSEGISQITRRLIALYRQRFSAPPARIDRSSAGWR